MALHLIAGRSGSGKSHSVYNMIIRHAMEAEDEQFIVLVPDQFTMQTQKELVRLHPAHSIMNIDVLSFSRLASRVFDEVGFDPGLILEDMGKTLILQKIIWDNKNALGILGKTMNKPGGAAEMKSLVSEFMEYRIAPADLAEAAERENVSPLLRGKLADVQLIYEKLKERLEGSCLAAEEVCEALSAVIGRSERLKGSTVVFDGFTGFVPVQLPVIRELLTIAKDVIVVITADERSGLIRKSSPSELFHMSHRMASQLAAMAREEGTAVEGPAWIDPDGGRFRTSAPIRFLEENLFRPKRQKWEGPQEDIHVVCAEDREEEIAFTASKIRKLVRTEGCRYRDFAVICADLSSCGAPLKRYLDQCGIPSFLDQKHSVLDDPFAQFIRGAAGIYAEDFSYDSVFAYLRSGLTGLEIPEIDRMENYVLAAGIRGFRQYSALWTRVPKTFAETDLPALNGLRERFLKELEGMSAAFRTRMSTVRTKTEAFYELCVACNVQQKLKKMEKAFAESGEKQREKEFGQIYKAVMDLFDKMVDILGEERIGLAAYQKLIETGLSEMRLGIIPTGPDEVFLGDIERSRVKNRKVLFFLGVNDGAVPKRSESAGLFNENDREVLMAGGMTLAPSAREDMYTQRFYLYLTLTLASRKIFLSYRKKGENGSGLMPSYLIGTVLRLFPGMQTECVPADLLLETAPGRKAALAGGLTGAAEDGKKDALCELILRIREDPEEGKILSDLQRGSGIFRKEAKIDAETAAAIYSDRYSVSRLQLFASCAFRHFCQYGLKLKERQIWQVNAADIGSIFHEVLKNFFELAKKEGGVAGLSDERRKALTSEAFERAAASDRNGILDGSSRNRALIRRLRRILDSTMEAVQHQIRSGEFVTEGVEVPYRMGRLSGVIDRYDVCRIGDTAYVRVIDYKSRETKINYTRMFYGLQIQLPVYLNAALDRLGEKEEARAAGIYYLGIDVPLQKADSIREEIDYSEFLKSMRFTGLTLDDPAVLRKIDENAEGSTVVPVRLKKDGGFHANSPVLSEGNFRLIERYTRRLVEEMEAAISAGTADIAPADSTAVGEDVCKYCSYHGICGYDEKIPGCKTQEMTRLDAKTICPAMSRKLNE